jgi:hypothetical protein
MLNVGRISVTPGTSPARGAVIRPEPAEWHPRMPERLDEEELADW